MQLITSPEALAEACDSLKSEEFITVDTEFIRDTTYWPQLCLIQIGGESEDYVVDPLADGMDLKPFYELMGNEDVLKVLHASRQDIEIFFHFGGVIPKPMVDTQVAAMVCGFGDSVGYDTLIRKTLNIPIDKSSRFSDWNRRPLTPKQIDYALSDVTHLRDAYRILRDKVAASDRSHWVTEEMEILTSPDTYALHPELAWRRLKRRNLNAKNFAVLIEGAAWREEQAQSRDMPRLRVMKDDVLYEIARACPKSADEMGELRGVPKGFARSRGAQALIEAVQKGKGRDRDTLPALEKSEPLPQRLVPIVELLKVLLKLRCEAHSVAPKLLASVSDLEKIALDDEADVSALHGWRREIFGDDAIKLKRGELGLAVNPRRGDHRVNVFPTVIKSDD